ncbi:MAG: hypothetical protein AAF757_24930 [Cyanobacteria bacterium P01_D01_bin.116]
MKTNILHFASFFYICTAIASVIISAIDTAFAQNTVPSIDRSVVNGLYSPTASELFFEEGRRKIERETQILVNPERYKRSDILQNNTIDTKIIEEKKETNPIFNDYYKQRYLPL